MLVKVGHGHSPHVLVAIHSITITANLAPFTIHRNAFFVNALTSVDENITDNEPMVVHEATTTNDELKADALVIPSRPTAIQFGPKTHQSLSWSSDPLNCKQKDGPLFWYDKAPAPALLTQ